jgi:hypothetical protein
MKIGSKRTSDSIKNKINRLMASYKEGNERMNQTGAGMDDGDLSTYQEWINNNVCKYYFELDSVLKDRPNVRPWFTNEKKIGPDMYEEDPKDNSHIDYSILDDSSSEVDNDIDCLTDNSGNKETSTSDETTDEYKEESECIFIQNTSISNPSNTITLTPVSQDNATFSNNTTFNSSDEYSSPPLSIGKNKRKQTTNRRRKLLPSEAKGIQRSLMKKKNKSVATKDLDGITNNLLTMDTKDREMIKEIESEKLRIESERLELEKRAANAKQNQIDTQTLLLKLDVLKKRETLKAEFPNLTEEYLDKNFPYPQYDNFN